MDDTAIFKLSYGMFYLGCGDNGKKNVCVVNTVAQVTQEPLKVSVTILKNNYTNELIFNAQKFSVGIMGQNASMDTIFHYGGQSGRSVDKLAGHDYKIDVLENPLVDEGCIASLCCKVCQTIDLGTHMMYIADIVDATNLSNDEPMTYKDYRDIRAGKKTPSQTDKAENADVWQCTICHYIYDGDVPFEDLPDDYICPICKKPKSAFQKV